VNFKRLTPGAILRKIGFGANLSCGRPCLRGAEGGRFSKQAKRDVLHGYFVTFYPLFSSEARFAKNVACTWGVVVVVAVVVVVVAVVVMVVGGGFKRS